MDTRPNKNCWNVKCNVMKNEKFFHELQNDRFRYLTEITDDI